MQNGTDPEISVTEKTVNTSMKSVYNQRSSITGRNGRGKSQYKEKNRKETSEWVLQTSMSGH